MFVSLISPSLRFGHRRKSLVPDETLAKTSVHDIRLRTKETVEDHKGILATLREEYGKFGNLRSVRGMTRTIKGNKGEIKKRKPEIRLT